MHKTSNGYVVRMIFFIRRYFGWRNWAVFVYNSIFENMFVLFFIALRQRNYSNDFIIDFFLFLLFSSFCTTYGYLINDLCDKELDRLQGKDNTFRDDSPLKSGMIVALFLLLSIVVSVRFVGNPFFVLLFVVWVCITSAYSMKPFRLKERGKVGLLFVVIAQRVLPALIVFSAFNYNEWLNVVVLTTYIFFRGLSSDVNHQLEDYQNDLRTGTDTYAIQAGQEKTRRILRLSLEMEKGLLIVCLALFSLQLPTPAIVGIPFIIPIVLTGATLCGAAWVKIMRGGRNIDINPFVPGRRDIFQFIHHGFPAVLLPLYLLLVLIYESRLFIIILCFFIIFRRLYSPELLCNNFLAKILSRIVHNGKLF